MAISAASGIKKYRCGGIGFIFTGGVSMNNARDICMPEVRCLFVGTINKSFVKEFFRNV